MLPTAASGAPTQRADEALHVVAVALDAPACPDLGSGQKRIAALRNGDHCVRSLVSEVPSEWQGEQRPAEPEIGGVDAREPQQGYLPVEAHIIEPLGSYDIVDLKVGSQMLRARTRSGFVPQAGERVFARIDPAQAHFFDKASGNSLGVRL